MINFYSRFNLRINNDFIDLSLDLIFLYFFQLKQQSFKFKIMQLGQLEQQGHQKQLLLRLANGLLVVDIPEIKLV